ncbi:Integral membrane protein GPR178, putative [Pediculus humanus corporis]|uniref:Integral membrane protein GPR178, putative n=1 Tax=Pediculus humanus subsp. corporis TaxID=121224 RepID=E0VS11_PEDHC|nr:Integral membrane protein GPR178, putative [Pediculus humanus corporis]EEB16167.1 Integral membrane protein GPR178, putative [Pediculus humanus corporis]
MKYNNEPLGVARNEIFDKTFHVSVEAEGISSEHKPIKLWKGNELRNRTRHIRCKQSTCDEFRIFHLGFLDYTHYVLTVHFYGLESFHKRYHIKEINIYFKTYNPAFTQLEIWFRFIFLFTSFITTFWFTHVLRRFSIQDWSIEQKWMSILLPLLLLYNNPFFPLSFLVNSSFPGILDAIFQETFLSAILLFWLCAYHGLRQNERRFLTFYVPKLLLILPMWLSSLTFAVNQRYWEWADPTYSYQIHTDQFYDYKIVYVVIGSLYGVYLGCLMLRVYSELRSMPYFDVRLKLLTTMLIIIVAFVFSLFLLKFGIGVVEDNFASELTTNYKSSAEFMALYGILNFTFYAMAYVYTPSTSLPFESQITKDNPTFSMINDSDEDVIYGSDEDTSSRQPLNRSCNNDDSD